MKLSTESEPIIIRDLSHIEITLFLGERAGEADKRERETEI